MNLNYYNEQDNNCYYILNNLDEETISMLKNPENDVKMKEKNPILFYYVLSAHNRDLLKWIDFNKDQDEVLEINSGIGAETKTLCERAKFVTTVNFSKQNAEIIEERLKDFNNYEVYVGNVREMDFGKKFDYIILTDVMEFCRAFFEESEFIKHFKSLLKPEGTLILTVANRYGIQYFSGSDNVISAKAFDSINSFPEVPFLKSFSKKDLENIFQKAEFQNVNFYYPIPNHYMNREILSDEYLSNSLFGRKILSKFANYTVNQNNVINEIRVIKDLAEENMFPFFANSYTIVASDSKKSLPYYTQFKDGVMTTLFNRDGKKYCKKTPLYPESKQIIDKMFEFYENETKRIEEKNIQNIKYAKCERDGDSLILDFAEGIPMNKLALDILYDPDKLLAFMVEYKQLITRLYPDLEYQTITMESENKEKVSLENVACVRNANIDLNLANIFKDGDNYTIIDYDRNAEVIPLNYIVAQGLFVFTVDANFKINEIEILKFLGMTEREISVYQALYAQSLRTA